MTIRRRSLRSGTGAEGRRARGKPAAPHPGTSRTAGRTAVRGALLATALAVLLTLTAWALGLPVPGTPGTDRDSGAPAARGGTSSYAAAVPPAGTGLDQHLTSLVRHLREQPRDAPGWAALGAGRVELARRTADPTLYTQAERALDRSLALRPAARNDAALAGRAALAAARHDFPSALRLARRSLAVNPYGELALAIRVDALVELGRYGPAHRAALRADALRPGIPAFSRLAYVRELRGERGAAREALTVAARSAESPADVAQTSTALGELDRAEGRSAAALRHYARALRADPGNLPALLGRGQVRAAEGQLPGAIRDIRAVVARQPLPAHLVLLGELYAANGRPAAAQRQYGLLGAWVRVARANGVSTDLDTALAAADHGDRREALRAARAEWHRRHTVHTADALAWALHRNDRDTAALPLIRAATERGYRNAMFLYHRSRIEHSLGEEGPARAHAHSALALSPALSPQARGELEREGSPGAAWGSAPGATPGAAPGAAPGGARQHGVVR
ncbi:tetratricopeptide repeat protein [Streptomyces sp. ODS28]|uniref:tetratricopeptide repeat protein n=1 Tax=Streptomyces sp. ODS28 TaxID=3136688 RepID=UPI0031EF7405